MRAHPRSRGEHVHNDRMEDEAAGSSPLARGTRLNHGALNIADGLIPARAGNTTREDLQLQLDGAHPRSRGEHGTIYGEVS